MAPPFRCTVKRAFGARSPMILDGLSLIAFRIIVDFGYSYLVAGPYAYWGFKGEPSLLRIVVSWVFFLALLPLLVRVIRSERLSARFVALLSLISLVPTTTLIANDPRYPVVYVILMFIYWLILLFSATYLPAIRIFRWVIVSDAVHLVTAGLLSAAVLYTSWKFTDFRLHFGLLDVYDLRVEARGFVMHPVLGYLGTFADNVLPILLAYYIRRRWYLLSIFLSGVILLNFGISGSKQVIFLLLFCFISIFVSESAQINRRITSVLAMVIFLAILERVALGTLFLGSFSMFRLFAIPAHTHWLYYDYFQGKEFVLLTQSILKVFFESPYTDNVQFLIGEYDRGEYGGRANNGLFSDGYLNFGPSSVLFFPVICVAIMKTLESAAEGLSSSVRFMIVASFSLVFLSLPLTTTMLSAGVGLVIILLPTLPRRDGGITGRC